MEKAKSDTTKNLTKVEKLKKEVNRMAPLQGKTMAAAKRMEKGQARKLEAENKLTDACYNACINTTGNPVSVGTYPHIENFNDEASEQYRAEFKKVVEFLIPTLHAKDNFIESTAGNHWWVAFLPILPIVASFTDLFAPIMRFYYQTPGSRFSWIMLLSGIATWHWSNLEYTVSDANRALKKARGLIGDFKSATAVR